jgi:hypothetical protein
MSILSTSGDAPRDDGPVLFWAARSRAAGWRGFVLTSLILSPLAFLAPDAFVLALAMGATLAVLNARAFRFEMTDRSLRLKPSVLAPRIVVPLASVARAEALPDVGAWLMPAQGDVGVVMVRLTDGRAFAVAGIVAPREAADAVNVLAGKARGGGTTAEVAPERADAA